MILFYKIGRNIAGCFRGYYLLFHILAAALTYVLMVSGFDWFYFTTLRNTSWYLFLFPAAVLGAFLPVLVPLLMLAIGKVRNNLRNINAAWGTGQAALLGLLISSSYKFFTGRIRPPFLLTASTPDISQVFRFGLMKGGVFWGWPSSHTTVAFAAAIALVKLYPENKLVKILALACACYVGVGVSAGIHWFSDFVAGAIIGSVIGVVVGNSFRARLHARAER
jgi:membrane-associated phospholipid phosphatase